MSTATVSSPELRKFGLMMAFVLMIIFGLVFPLLFSKDLPTLPWVIGSPFLLLALTKPSWLKMVYVVWMKVGHVLGFINTRIILGFIYFLLITPIGIMLRIAGKDPMNKRYDAACSSYRKDVPPHPINHMEKPF